MPSSVSVVLDGVEDVAGQLDVAQHVGDLLGVDAARLAAPLEQRLPLGGVDAGHLGGLDRVVATFAASGRGSSTAGLTGCSSRSPAVALLHPTMQPT